MNIFLLILGGGKRQPSKGKDVLHKLGVSLEDMYNGATKRLSLQKNVVCEKCRGLGVKDGANLSKTCTPCRGKGVVIKLHQLGPSMVQQVIKKLFIVFI